MGLRVFFLSDIRDHVNLLVLSKDMLVQTLSRPKHKGSNLVNIYAYVGISDYRVCCKLDT